MIPINRPHFRKPAYGLNCSLFLCCLVMCQAFAGTTLDPNSDTYRSDYNLYLCLSLEGGDFIRVMNRTLRKLDQPICASHVHSKRSAEAMGSVAEANFQTLLQLAQENTDDLFYPKLDEVLSQTHAGLHQELTGSKELQTPLYVPGDDDNRRCLDVIFNFLDAHGFSVGSEDVWNIVKYLPMDFSRQRCESREEDALSTVIEMMKRQSIHWGYIVRAIEKTASGYKASLLQSVANGEAVYKFFLVRHTALMGDKNYVTLNQLDGATDFISEIEHKKVQFMLALKAKHREYSDKLSLHEMLRLWMKKTPDPTVEMLVKAFQLPTVSNPALAKKIKEYCSNNNMDLRQPLRVW